MLLSLEGREFYRPLTRERTTSQSVASREDRGGPLPAPCCSCPTEIDRDYDVSTKNVYVQTRLLRERQTWSDRQTDIALSVHEMNERLTDSCGLLTSGARCDSGLCHSLTH
eukprot:GHVU01068542.1.p1 GENE.GHVU01068542.1~~GHVU01068542.1.p1  ORF type:complete len:111 (-),score=7.69 GHVU01068542.1:12-344(-)